MSLTLSSMLFLMGCELEMKPDGQLVDAELDPLHSSALTHNDQYVCDPLGGNGGAQGDRLGIQGKLFHIPEYARTTAEVGPLLDQSVRVQADLYLNDINVPTRPFDRGFQLANGQVIQKPNGDTLYEYFGFDLNAKLQLGDLEPGHYQFALLSDDGAILSLDAEGNGLQPWVNNDGLHPTRFACASETVFIDHGSQIPMQLQYYQGPRYHIALMLLARKVDELDHQNAQFLNDPACGSLGNSRFFDSNRPQSPPQQAFLDLQARGWRVLAANNFSLPDTAKENPCQNIEPQEPIVSTKPPVSITEPCTGLNCANGGIGI